MFQKNQFFWILVLSIIVFTLAERKKNLSKRQLREFLLENDENLIPKSDESFNNTYKSSRPKYDLRWFTALSKIARIRTADGRSWNISNDFERNQSGQKKVDYLEDFSKHKLHFEKSKSGLIVSSLHFKPRKFHCQPMSDMYVPKANRTLPAYMCKLGSRHFVLTSEKFLQDRKSYVDVNIDEATFLRLSTSNNTSNNSNAEVIPATLIFNKEQNDYGIKRT